MTGVKNEQFASCLLSLYDSLKLYDNNSLEMQDESLSELLFRKMKAYNIDLNKELGFTHLSPVKSLPVADYFRLVSSYDTEMSTYWIDLDITDVSDVEIEYVQALIKVCEQTYDMTLINRLDEEFHKLMSKVLKKK
jgi:hypothetical protein